MVRYPDYENVLCTECNYYLKILGMLRGTVPLLDHPEYLDDREKYKIECESCKPKMKMAMKQFAKAVMKRGKEGDCGVKWIDIEVEGDHDCEEVIAYEKENGTRVEKVKYEIPLNNRIVVELPFDQDWVDVEEEGLTVRKPRCKYYETYPRPWKCQQAARHDRRTCTIHEDNVRIGPKTPAGVKWESHRGGCMAEARKKGLDVDDVCCPEEEYYKIMFEHDENGKIKYYKDGVHDLPIYRPCEECGHVAVLDKMALVYEKSHELHRPKASQTYKWNLQNEKLWCLCKSCNSKHANEDKLDHKEKGTVSMKPNAIRMRDLKIENDGLREELEAAFQRETKLEYDYWVAEERIIELEETLKDYKDCEDMIALFDTINERRIRRKEKETAHMHCLNSNKRVVSDEEDVEDLSKMDICEMQIRDDAVPSKVSKVEDTYCIDVTLEDTNASTNMEGPNQQDRPPNGSVNGSASSNEKKRKAKAGSIPYDQTEVLDENGEMVPRCSKTKKEKHIDWIWRCPNPSRFANGRRYRQCEGCAGIKRTSASASAQPAPENSGVLNPPEEINPPTPTVVADTD